LTAVFFRGECMEVSKSVARMFYSSVLLLYVFAQTIFGHAHIFIDYKVHACINDEGLDGVFVNWTFDAMFTQFVQKEFDKDNDKKLNKDEQAAIFNKFTNDHKKVDYFAVIKVDGKNYSVPAPANFSARILPENNLVSYTFFLPLKLKASGKPMEVQVYFFDAVIYVSFTIMPKDVSIQNKSKNIDASISLEKGKFSNIPTISLKAR